MIGSQVLPGQNSTDHATLEDIESRFIDSVHHFVLSQATSENLEICRHLLDAVRAHIEANGGLSGESGFWQLTSEARLTYLEGAPEGALEQFNTAIEFIEAQFGSTHYLTGVGLCNLAELHASLGQKEKASALLERAFPILELALSDNEGLPLEPFLAHCLVEVVSASQSNLSQIESE